MADRLGVEQELKASREALETVEAQIRGHESRRNEATEKAATVREALEDQRVQRQGMAVQEDNLLEQLATTGHALEAVQRDMPVEASETAWVEEEPL